MTAADRNRRRHITNIVLALAVAASAALAVAVGAVGWWEFGVGIAVAVVVGAVSVRAVVQLRRDRGAGRCPGQAGRS